LNRTGKHTDASIIHDIKLSACLISARKPIELPQWALCTAALLPGLQPAPCFLYAIIGQN